MIVVFVLEKDGLEKGGLEKGGLEKDIYREQEAVKQGRSRRWFPHTSPSGT
jgi:hypothetical protein